jgi:F-type H+-transporting ATPase subunit delta
MKVTQVSIRYARSLFELALEQKELEEVYLDIRLMQKVCAENRSFRLMLQSPIVQTDKKARIIREVFGKSVRPLTLNFILLLARKRRESFIPPIADSFIEQYQDYRKILPVSVKTPGPLSEETRAQAMSVMSKFTGAQIEFTEETDPDLIGGFILTWKDLQYDATLSHQIEKLRRGVGKQNLYVKDR